MSPSWPTMPGPARRDCPPRVTSTGRYRSPSDKPDNGWPQLTSGNSRSTRLTSPVGSVQAVTASSGRSRRMTWSTVQLTVATVGIPSRW